MAWPASSSCSGFKSLPSPSCQTRSTPWPLRLTTATIQWKQFRELPRHHPDIAPSHLLVSIDIEEDRTMTQSFNSAANHNADREGATPGDRGVAGALRNLAYAAIRPLRYRMHYQKIFGELASLDDEVL